jgi:hypothetical protein
MSFLNPWSCCSPRWASPADPGAPAQPLPGPAHRLGGDAFPQPQRAGALAADPAARPAAAGPALRGPAVCWSSRWRVRRGPTPSWLPGERRAGVVIAIDSSFSMGHGAEGAARFDEAMKRVEVIRGKMAPGDPVTLPCWVATTAWCCATWPMMTPAFEEALRGLKVGSGSWTSPTSRSGSPAWWPTWRRPRRKCI